MIIDSLRQEHRNMEKLLVVLERELSVFDRGERPDCKFLVYPDAYHHPQEVMVFEKLKARDPTAAGKYWRSRGRAPERHQTFAAGRAGGRECLSDREVLRRTVHDIILDFIEHERCHIAMEERDFLPAAVKALQNQDWA